MTTYTWNVNASGVWSDAGDWTPGGPPANGSDVVIDTTNFETISYSSVGTTLNSLNVGNDEFEINAGSLTVTGAASFANVLQVSGATFTSQGTVSIADRGGYSNSFAMILSDDASWSNTGTVDDAGDIYFSDTVSHIDNAAGATFNITSDDGQLGLDEQDGAGILTNEGTFQKTNGTGVSNVSAVLTNTGTISSRSGTLEFNGGGSLGGTFSTSGSGVIALGGGVFGVVGSSASLGGDILLVNGILSPGSGNTMTLTGADTFGASGYYTHNYGSLSGPGTLITSGSTTVTDMGGNSNSYAMVLSDGATWSNTGTVYDAGDIYFNDTLSRIDNAAGGTFNITSVDGQLGLDENDGSGILTNEGTFQKTNGTGVSNVSAALTNTGTISCSSGTLQFNGGGSLGGTFSTSGSGVIALGGGAFGVFGSSASLGGNILVVNGTLSAGSGKTMTLTGTDTFGASGYYTNNYGSISGAGTVITGGSTTVTDMGGYSNSYAMVLSNSASWSNTGTVNDAGDIYFSDTLSHIDNAAGGTFDITSVDGQLGLDENSGVGVLTNEGTFQKTNGNAVSNVSAVLTNTGTISCSSGTLQFNGGGSLGGTFSTSGAGVIALGGGAFGVVGASASVGGNILVVNGALSPGNGNTLTLTGTDTFGAAGYYTHNYGAVSGAGTVITSGSTTIADMGSYSNSYAMVLSDSASWRNTGTVNDAGDIYFNDSVSQIDNAAGATFNITSDDGQLGLDENVGVGILTNEGTFQKTNGAKVSNVSAALTNTGAISSSSGTLQFNGGGSLGGTFSTSGSGVIALGGGVFGVVGSSASVGGNILVVNGTLSPGNGNTLTLTGTDTFGAAGYYTNNYGAVSGAGTVITSGSTTITDMGGYSNSYAMVLSDGATWSNTGAVNDSGDIYFNDTVSHIDNAVGGTFSITSDDGQIGSGENVGTGVLTNEGTFQKTNGTSVCEVSAVLTNTGAISSSSGTLEFNGGGSLGGTFSTSGSGVIALGGGAFGVVGSSASVGGDILIVNGTLSPGSGNTLTLTGTDTFGASGYYSDNYGALSGPGTLITSGATTITDLGGYSDALVLSDNAYWSNTGSVNDAGDIYFADTVSHIDNAAGATFNITSEDGQIGLNDQVGAGIFTNEGTLTTTGGSESTYVSAGFTNTGTVTNGGEGFDFADGGTFGGTIDGSGELSLGGDSTLSGLTISGDVTVSNYGLVTQSGQVTLASALVNADQASYEIASASGISLGAGGALTNDGLFEKIGGGGVSTIAVAIDNNGTIEAANGTLDLLGSATGTGGLEIYGAATLQLGVNMATSETVSFLGVAKGRLILDDLATNNHKLFKGKIAGFGAGDFLDLGAPFGKGTTFSFVEAQNKLSGFLTIANGAHEIGLTLLGKHHQIDFFLTKDGSGGKMIGYI